MSSSHRKSIRKYFKPSRYIRKFGSAEKIETFINKYLDPDNNNKINIEHLLTTPSYFTYASVSEYIRNNQHIYLNSGPGTMISNAFNKLCKVYAEHENKGSEDKGSENKGSENKGSENKGSENNGSENKESENKGSENNGSENKGSENNGSENKEPFFRIVRGDVFESKYEKPSFRKIKCVWFFHELLKILSDKENKGLRPDDVLDIFEDKVNHLQTILRKCREGAVNFVPVTGIMELGKILLLGRPQSIKRVGGKTRKRDSSRFDLKK